MKSAYVIGGLGNAGQIICNQLAKLLYQVHVIDKQLTNDVILDVNSIPNNSLVFVAVPPKAHYTYLKQLTDKRCRIFIEKPLVYSLQGDEIDLKCFCNFNMTWFNLPTKGVQELGRFVQDKKPAYLEKGDRGVVLDLMPHLLSIFDIDRLRRLRIVDVRLQHDSDENDVYAFVKFNSFTAVVGYQLANIIWVNYGDEVLAYHWLPDRSWLYTISKFLNGETNTAKAVIISRLVDNIYDNS